MLRHTLKLIALAAMISVTPALAGQPATNQGAWHRPDCPKKQAQSRAATAQAQRTKGGSISLSDRVAEGSFLDFGFRRGILTP